MLELPTIIHHMIVSSIVCYMQEAGLGQRKLTASKACPSR